MELLDLVVLNKKDSLIYSLKNERYYRNILISEYFIYQWDVIIQYH